MPILPALTSLAIIHRCRRAAYAEAHAAEQYARTSEALCAYERALMVRTRAREAVRS